MKKPIIIGLIIVLFLGAVFTLGYLSRYNPSSMGKSAAGSPEYSRDVAAEESIAPQAEPYPTDSIVEQGEADRTGEKIIRDVRYEIRSKTFEVDLEFLTRLPDQFGGKVETVDQGTNYYGSDEQRYYNVTYRIPTDRLDDFLTELEKDRPIFHKYYNQYTVTDTYNQTEARLNTLIATEERYLNLLEKAESIEDIIAVEQALTNVQSEIEWLTITKDRFDKDIDYTAVRVSLVEVLASESLTGQSNFWDEIKDAFVTGMASFFAGLRNLILFFLKIWPLLILIAAGIVFFLVRYRRHKTKE